jgi:CheY-like chemotaxis protein
MNGNLKNYAGFRVNLPRLGNGITPQAENLAPVTPARERILCVDNEKQVVEVVQILLEHLGYRVTALTSSLEAREVFHRRPQEFDLVITDLALPQMTGLELAADFVKLRPDLPVILHSGFNESLCLETAWQSGIRKFVRKPANIMELVRAIRQVLDSQKEYDRWGEGQ